MEQLGKTQTMKAQTVSLMVNAITEYITTLSGRPPAEADIYKKLLEAKHSILKLKTIADTICDVHGDVAVRHRA